MSFHRNVYIVQCCDGTYYTGITNDLEKRIEAHNAGSGAKYTRARTPVHLVWSHEAVDKSQASQYEYYIKKKCSRTQKHQLVGGILSVDVLLGNN